MDPIAILNFAVVTALLFLAISLTLLVSSVMPLLRQSEATLMSVRKLSDTLDKEIPPTLDELRGVMDGVNQIRALTAQRVQEVGTRAEAVAGNVNHIVDNAKKESSVYGAGIFAGIKTYFFGNESSPKENK